MRASVCRNPLFILSFIILVLSVLEGRGEGGMPGDVREETDDPRYREVVRGIASDADRAGLLRDYLLFFTAKDSCKRDDHHRCLREIERFLVLFSGTYLTREMRLLRLRTLHAMLNHDPTGDSCSGDAPVPASLEGEALRSAEDYLKDYPDDEEALYLYARMLKRSGKDLKARRIFKSLYIRAGEYYSEVQGMISPEELTVEEVLVHNRNLYESLRLKESEALLLNALRRKPLRRVRTLYIALADTYFRMKDYRRAALYYRKGGDEYKAAISLYRHGDLDAFNGILRKVRHERTSATCRLYMLKGLGERRDGRVNRALGVFRRLYRGYPCKEEALWQIAWTEYLTGNYLSASYNLKTLYKRHRAPKYLYWYARALERRGFDAGRLYRRLPEDSFYSVMVGLRSGVPARGTPLRDIGTALTEETGTPVSGRLARRLRRAELLEALGLHDYAVKELLAFESTSKGSERSLVCIGLHRIRAYNEALRCANRTGAFDGAHRISYPVAYREIVMGVAEEFAIDPLIIYSVMREESRFDEDAFSRAGAVGLMQLMPYTARRMARSLSGGVEVTSSRDIIPPHLNITLGSLYLKQLLEEFKSIPLAAAAYNAGEGAVRRWLDSHRYRDVDEFIEDIPYRETRKYVKRVLKTYFKYLDIYVGKD